jgi:hypothetical protein
VKLQTDTVEVNILASRDDFLQLWRIRQAEWEARQSLQIGRSAGSPVFWCSAEGGATIMIGDDDETWNIATSIPFEVIDEVISEVIAVTGRGE